MEKSQEGGGGGTGIHAHENIMTKGVAPSDHCVKRNEANLSAGGRRQALHDPDNGQGPSHQQKTRHELGHGESVVCAGWCCII